MRTGKFKQDELKEFMRLIDLVSSSNQMNRITGRLEMKNFVSNHGQNKCDEMWAHLKKEGFV